jgi:hypothetical protein
MATNDDILKISDESQNLLVEYIRAACTIRDEGWQLRTRFEDIDRAYLRERDFTEEQRKAQLANRRGDPTKLQNLQVPTIMETAETSVGFLRNVFTTEYPMFKFGADVEQEDLALQWNTLVGEDQLQYGWAGEFDMAFRNAEKYNFAPIECDWDKNIRYKPQNGSGNAGVALQQVVWEGNCIKTLDPYNTIYDPRVPIHKVHELGEFAGYIEQIPRILLKRQLTSLGDSRLKNDVKAFETPNWEVEFYTPLINPNAILRNRNWSDGAFNWANWMTDQAQNHIQYQNMYTKVVLYCRLMPFEFGIKAPRDQTPDVWKLIAVNGVLVYAQPMPNAHDYLPVIIGQSRVNTLSLSHQEKSPAENMLPFQEMSSALWNAKLQSARRRTTDRMLYNPLLVDPDHINSPNPSAKIPIRPTAYGRKLEEAVYQIPFHDENSQYFVQEATAIQDMGRRSQGQNAVSQGQFQKGNKLQGEFETVMANASMQDRAKALSWEVNVFTPVKTILKSNYLQFTPKGTRYNRMENKPVDIDPTVLRKTEMEFQMGDGLLPIQRIMHSDVMTEAFQTLQSVPGLAAQYNTAPLFTYLMKLRGVDKLGKFEKSKEDMQFEQQLAAWTKVAETYAGVAAGKMAPEDIAKAIGPMPQPPKPKQALPAPNANT